MRKHCLSCARKHLAQAEVLMLEAMKGYPLHSWLAIGHLSEAEDELLAKYPEMANKIRQHRIAYMDDQVNYKFPTLDLIDDLCLYAENESMDAVAKAVVDVTPK